MSKERDMAEENTAAEAAEDQTTDDQTTDDQESAADAGANAPDPETEDRARRMGWAPKEEFRGDPERWVDAETYVRRGEEIQPILKANMRKLEADNAELKQTLRDLTDHMGRSEARMYQKALQDITAAQRKAVEDGDTATFDNLERQKQGVVKEAMQSGKPKKGAEPEVDPVAQEWAERNRWFQTNKEMATFASAYLEGLEQTTPGNTLEQNLQEVEKAVKKAFPEKFTNPRRNGAQTVEGATGPKRGGGKTYADLPADAKAACDRLVKQEVLKKEDYIKDYFAE